MSEEQSNSEPLDLIEGLFAASMGLPLSVINDSVMDDDFAQSVQRAHRTTQLISIRSEILSKQYMRRRRLRKAKQHRK